MNRWLIWTPLGTLVLFGAVMAFRAGWITAHVTESAAITYFAERYMAETGAPAADCSARPGETHWLVIRCGTGQMHRIYRVNRWGWAGGATSPTKPEYWEPST